MQRKFSKEKNKQDWIRKKINKKRTKKSEERKKEDVKRLSSSSAIPILQKKENP